jgi:hypothetical protein
LHLLKNEDERARKIALNVESIENEMDSGN